MATKLTKQDGEEHDDIRGAKRLPTEEKRAHRLREHEYGGDGDVLDKIRMVEGGNAASHLEFRETELTITQEKEADWDILASVASMELDNRQRRQVAFDVTTMVPKRRLT